MISAIMSALGGAATTAATAGASAATIGGGVSGGISSIFSGGNVMEGMGDIGKGVLEGGIPKGDPAAQINSTVNTAGIQSPANVFENRVNALEGFRIG